MASSWYESPAHSDVQDLTIFLHRGQVMPQSPLHPVYGLVHMYPQGQLLIPTGPGIAVGQGHRSPGRIVVVPLRPYRMGIGG